MLSALTAVSELWLAVSFHLGIDDHCLRQRRHELGRRPRGLAGRRRRAHAPTSAGDTSDARLPNEFRTYDAIAAIHSSVFCPIAIMTSGYVVAVERTGETVQQQP